VILKPIEQRTRLHSLTLKNFMSYKHFHIEFGDNPIHGLFGPNGCGKSTMLEAIRLLFSKFGGFDCSRLKQNLSKYVSNGSGETFEIIGEFISDDQQYSVRFGNDPGLWEWKEVPELGNVLTWLVHGHPKMVRRTLVEQCYMSTYDQQLHQFQIEKSRWERFKPLFEAVTGYSVRPVESTNEFISNDMYSDSEKIHLEVMKKYIFGIEIMKPSGPIREYQCSDGEKKVLKHFTTIFNKPDNEIPSIILIDNIELHIARDRQLPLLRALENCFPNSQIIFTTHGDSIICHYDASRLTNLYYKDHDQNVEPWRKEAMRIAAVGEMLLPDSLSTLMEDLKGMSKNDARDAVRNIFNNCADSFSERIK